MQNLDIIELKSGNNQVASDYVVINHRGQCVEIQLSSLVGTLTLEQLETLIPALEVAVREITERVDKRTQPFDFEVA